MKPYEPALIAEIERALSAFATSPPLTLSKWAQEHFYLSADSSQTAGRWEPYPYQTTIMDLISNDSIQQVFIRKPARVGFTKILVAAVGYFAEHRGRNMALWQPTDEDSDDFCKTEIEPMLRDVEVMHKVFKDHDKRSNENTLRMKVFNRSRLYLRGGKAAKNFRRITVAVSMLDEVDKFDRNVEKAGDPITLAKKRLEGATFPKLIAGSTPLLKGLSHIDTQVESSEVQIRFYIPCPHCWGEHTLTWGGKEEPHGFKWIDNQPGSVRHQCPHCAVLIDQSEYLAAAQMCGRWKTDDGRYFDTDGNFRAPDDTLLPAPKSVGVSLWTGYSPQVTWPELVEEYLKAYRAYRQGRPEILISFTNETLGESWESKTERRSWEDLKKRATDRPRGVVPVAAPYVFRTVDTQDDRWEINTWGIGRKGQMWAIDTHVINGNPAIDADWNAVADYLDAPLIWQGGGTIKAFASAVDTGGHHTHAAYNFCRKRNHKRTYAVKGDLGENRRIAMSSSLVDVNERGAIIKAGLRLHRVATDTAKDTLEARLGVKEFGPGHVSFAAGLPDEFYQQLCAEARLLVKTSAGEKHRWTKVEDRNEALDCAVYVLFLEDVLNLYSQSEEIWKLREIAVARSAQPPQAPVSSTPQPLPRSPFASEEWSNRM